ncbi:MAG: hypothetical protein M0Z46_23215 [Actinomycetota bacterium]|nr:hypothetical protein [Actinomycetota bacterium]
MRAELGWVDALVAVTVAVVAEPGEVAVEVRWKPTVEVVEVVVGDEVPEDADAPAFADAVLAILTDADADVTGAEEGADEEEGEEGDVAAGSTGEPDRWCEDLVALERAPAPTVPSPKATFMSTTAKVIRPVRTIHLRLCVRTESMSPPVAQTPKQATPPGVPIRSLAEDRDACDGWSTRDEGQVQPMSPEFFGRAGSFFPLFGRR